MGQKGILGPAEQVCQSWNLPSLVFLIGAVLTELDSVYNLRVISCLGTYALNTSNEHEIASHYVIVLRLPFPSEETVIRHWDTADSGSERDGWGLVRSGVWGDSCQHVIVQARRGSIIDNW